MKLLFYRYGSICEPFLLSAFHELGMEVTELSSEMYNKNMKPGETAEQVSRLLLDGNFNLVFSVNFFPAVSEVCNIFHIPYAGWTVDSPVMELYSRSVTNACNYLFLFDRCQYEEIAPLNPGHVFYLPLATDPAYMQSVILACTDNSRFRSDLSFVGSLYTEKCPYDRLLDPPAYLSGFLDGIMAAQRKIYGYYFIEELLTEDIIREFKAHLPGFYSPQDAPYLTDQAITAQLYIGNKISALERTAVTKLLASRLSASGYTFDLYTGSDTSGFSGLRNRGFAKTLTEMPLIFRHSTINLNMTSKPIRSGIPLRIWDILGCGGFVITNYQTELPEYFVPGETLEVYESEEDLCDKCLYYLDHPALTREIAECGLALVREKHTYVHRLETLLYTVLASRQAESKKGEQP